MAVGGFAEGCLVSAATVGADSPHSSIMASLRVCVHKIAEQAVVIRPDLHKRPEALGVMTSPPSDLPSREAGVLPAGGGRVPDLPGERQGHQAPARAAQDRQAGCGLAAFASAGVDNPPLHALPSPGRGGNGRYLPELSGVPHEFLSRHQLPGGRGLH